MPLLMKEAYAPLTIGNTISLAVCYYLALALDWLLVGLDVEVDEKTQIARQQEAANDSSRFRSGAATQVGEVRPVVRGVIVVG